MCAVFGAVTSLVHLGGAPGSSVRHADDGELGPLCYLLYQAALLWPLPIFKRPPASVCDMGWGAMHRL